jgi:hypothetical protein
MPRNVVYVEDANLFIWRPRGVLDESVVNKITVFTREQEDDRSGNVYRKSGNEWQQRDKNAWSKPAAGKSSDFAKSRSQLERDNVSRQRGQQMQRQQSSQRSGAGTAGSRSGGGNGGRRR